MYKVMTISFLQEDPALIKKFQLQSRNLWNDHAWRLRNYIVSSIQNSPDSAVAGKWVVENITEISSVLKDFYGEEESKKLFDILRSYVSKLASKIELIKTGESVSSLQLDDYEIINSLAFFLESLNPVYWKREDTIPLFQSIFELWLNQMLSRTAQEWEMDLTYTDEINEKLLTLSDIFAGGLIAQFPEKFTKGGEYVLL